MEDPYGVELTDDFDHEITIMRNTWDGDIATETVVSLDFWNKQNGERLNEYPENNRIFTWDGIETETDAEILEKFYILVPELK